MMLSTKFMVFYRTMVYRTMNQAIFCDIFIMGHTAQLHV